MLETLHSYMKHNMPRPEKGALRHVTMMHHSVGGKMGADRIEQLADLWEQAQLNLESHTIQCLNGRNAFRHAFYIARDLVARDYGAGELSSKITTNPPRRHKVILDIKEKPLVFVDGYLKPTFKAMNLIFSWDTSINADMAGIDDEELRYYRMSQLQCPTSVYFESVCCSLRCCAYLPIRFQNQLTAATWLAVS